MFQKHAGRKFLLWKYLGDFSCTEKIKLCGNFALNRKSQEVWSIIHSVDCRFYTDWRDGRLIIEIIGYYQFERLLPKDSIGRLDLRKTNIKLSNFFGNQSQKFKRRTWTFTEDALWRWTYINISIRLNELGLRYKAGVASREGLGALGPPRPVARAHWDTGCPRQ